MKEFIDKLLGRLEEYKKQWMDADYLDGIDEIIEIVNQLAEEYNNSNDSMEIQIAKNYAKWLTKCGVNVTEKWLTATEQASALNEAYMRGMQDERDRFAEWQDEHEEKVMIDGQYCWQTCGATEHCKECNRLCNGSIDYYENYDFMAEEHNGGWISCSERLPSYDGPFICTAKGVEGSLELIYSSWDNSWMDELDSEYEVIAWQPLPPKFDPKGE